MTNPTKQPPKPTEPNQLPPVETEVERLKWQCFELRIKFNMLMIEYEKREKYIKYLEERTSINN